MSACPASTARQLPADLVAGVSLHDQKTARPSDVGQQVDRARLAYEWNGDPRYAVERLFDVQRREQTAHVGEEFRATQEPLTIGDVAKTPYPTHHFFAELLRNRIAFEDSPILETQDVEALRVRGGIKIVHALEKA